MEWPKKCFITNIVEKVESRLDRLETKFINHVPEISVMVARIEQKLDMNN